MQGEERRDGTAGGAGAQLHRHRERTQQYCRQQTALRLESVCDEFDAAVIEALGVDAEVAHIDTAGDGSPGFAENPRSKRPAQSNTVEFLKNGIVNEAWIPTIKWLMIGWKITTNYMRVRSKRL